MHTAESAEEALEVIDDLILDERAIIYAVISDWLMPGMKGDELLTKAAQKINGVKTILLTGYVENNLIHKIKNEADNNIQCIFKPWDENHLIQLINAS